MNNITKLILMLGFEIPAIFLSILIVFYFILNRDARSKLENHGWFVLSVVNFIQLTIDLPMVISYYRTEMVLPTTNIYCIWWIWCEYSLNAIGLFLMAWICVERHMLVFRPYGILQKPWKKYLFHFIPIVLCLTYSPLLYFVLVVISPYCINKWDFNLITCGSPCYFTANFIGQFDFIFNIAIPVIIIMLANLALVVRVVYRKASRNQVINWRRHRKMVLQLLIVSSLYMVCWLPTTITWLVQITVMPSFMIDQIDIIYFTIYFIPLLLPIICLSTLPALIKKLENAARILKLNVIGINADQQGTQQAATHIHT